MSPLLVQEISEEEISPTLEASPTINLTPVEATLRRLLLDVAHYIDTTPPPDTHPETQLALPDALAKEPLTLRFTGGWVRDKLLGQSSHDIDVAINKMSGYQFGLRLKHYLSLPENAAKYGLEGLDSANPSAGTTAASKTVGGLHKIEANPAKSKHLETVTTRILGLDIDLVNLRRETYTSDSRNPAIAFGTPAEDALRRDATVNALFYNIHTSAVEDFTGRGRADLAAGILRTPLPPEQTFEDDPLRVLRLIRFASRLGYSIEPAAREAMGREEVKKALARKISRERVGVEVEKALRGPRPHVALELLFELGLYGAVFEDPTVQQHYRPEIEGWDVWTGFWRDIVEAEGPLGSVLVRDDEDRFLAWLLAALVPYRDAPEPQAAEPGRKTPPPLAAAVAREGIKATNKVCEVVTAAVKHQAEISALVDKLYEQKRRPDKKVEGEDASARDVLGMAIRRWGPSWRSQATYAMLVEVADGSSGGDAVSSIERKYTIFINHLQTLNILDAYTFKPLMDGKTLAKALKIPPGPWMKDALDVVMAYQLRYPDSASTEAAVAEVEQSRLNAPSEPSATAAANGSENAKGKGKMKGGELTSNLIQHFLKLTIRPLFLKADTPSSITATGRKNTTTVLPKKFNANADDDKPWKTAPTALALLRWCITALDAKTVEGVWHLLIPPLLTLLDDWEVKNKALGAELIAELLSITPPALLAKTGLGDVFAEALMPCLTFLPPVTEEGEAVGLVGEVYPALLALARVRYPAAAPQQGTTATAVAATGTTADAQRTHFLDTVIRKGIIYSLTHTTPALHPHLTTTLLTHVPPFLTELGIESVKHLKFLLPVLTSVLSRPRASSLTPAAQNADAEVEMLRAANAALQALILNAWPRVLGYRGEVLKGLVFCWIGLGEEGKAHVPEVEGEEGLRLLRGEMRETVGMLRVVVGREVDFEAECQTLVDADPRVGGLFAVVER